MGALCRPKWVPISAEIGADCQRVNCFPVINAPFAFSVLPARPRCAQLEGNENQAMTPTIRIKTALAEIDQLAAHGQQRSFSLDYVRRNGTLGRKARLVKGGSAGGAYHVPAEGSEGLGYNLKKSGLLLVQDQSSGEMRSIKIRRITYYNNLRVLHG